MSLKPASGSSSQADRSMSTPKCASIAKRLVSSRRKANFFQNPSIQKSSGKGTPDFLSCLQKFSMDTDSALFLLVLFSTNQLRGKPLW